MRSRFLLCDVGFCNISSVISVGVVLPKMKKKLSNLFSFFFCHFIYVSPSHRLCSRS